MSEPIKRKRNKWMPRGTYCTKYPTDLFCGCGGRISLRDYGPDSREFRWESSCDDCATCDANGWSSRAKAIESAKTYFAGIKEAANV